MKNYVMKINSTHKLVDFAVIIIIFFIIIFTHTAVGFVGLQKNKEVKPRSIKHKS